MRLQRLRKNQGWTQQELADRAGLDVGTIKNLEKKGQCSLLTLIRVSTALDCVNDFSTLFQLKIKSIAALEKNENSKPQRIRQRGR
jgi:transcriptional regulator with XRE-family HTH domain